MSEEQEEVNTLPLFRLRWITEGTVLILGRKGKRRIAKRIIREFTHPDIKQCIFYRNCENTTKEDLESGLSSFLAKMWETPDRGFVVLADFTVDKTCKAVRSVLNNALHLRLTVIFTSKHDLPFSFDYPGMDYLIYSCEGEPARENEREYDKLVRFVFDSYGQVPTMKQLRKMKQTYKCLVYPARWSRLDLTRHVKSTMYQYCPEKDK